MPEEILLLALNDDGLTMGVPPGALDLAVAGAVIMELGLLGRLDSDPDRLYLATPAPTGDALLDDVLVRVAGDPARDSRWWMAALAREAGALRKAFLDRLVIRGVLRRVKGGGLLRFRDERRYPPVDGLQVTEVRARLRDVLLSGETPDPRDALMIGLCRATGLVTLILSDEEARGRRAGCGRSRRWRRWAAPSRRPRATCMPR